MKKITKTPKSVDVYKVATKSFYYEHHCPTCGGNFVGGFINASTVSFRCICGQVLIIDRVVEK